MLVLAYILCTIFKLKYKSVHIYSRKYAYILRSVHDHVSGTVALFVRRKLCARRYFCIQISSQKRVECSRKHPGPHGHCCLLVCSLWRTFTFVYYFLATIQMCSFYIVAMTLLLYEASIGRLGDFDHELVIVHELFTCS